MNGMTTHEVLMTNFEMMVALKRTTGFFAIESSLADRVIQIFEAEFSLDPNATRHGLPKRAQQITLRLL